MADEMKDARAVELGRRGGLARRSRQTPEERKAIARLGGIARAAKATTRREHEALLPTNVTELVPVSYEITPWEAMRGAKVGDDPQAYIDRRWTPRLIRFFEQTMQSYTRAGNLDGALHVATVMAGMTSTLSRARLRRQAERCISEMQPDLSHLSDEQIQAMRDLLEPGKIAAPTPADEHSAAMTDAESSDQTV